MSSTSISASERAQLAAIAYDNSLEPGDRVGKWTVLDSIDSDNSGLLITALINEDTNRIEFIIGGTNDAKDFGPDSAFLTGRYDDQFRESIDFVDGYVADYEKLNYTFGTAGHSLGGGISQLLSYTFGFEGLSLEAPPAGSIIKSQAYQDHIASLGRSPQGVPDSFINYTENASTISFIGSYLGYEVELNLVSDFKSFLSVASIIAGPTNPINLIIAGSLFVNDQVLADDSQHGKAKYLEYFSTSQNPDSLGDYYYRKGAWYLSSADIAGEFFSEKDSPVTDEKTLGMLNANRKLLSENNDYLEPGYTPLTITRLSDSAQEEIVLLPDGWRTVSSSDGTSILQHTDGSTVSISNTQYLYTYADGSSDRYTLGPDGEWDYARVPVESVGLIDQDKSILADNESTDEITATENRPFEAPDNRFADILSGRLFDSPLTDSQEASPLYDQIQADLNEKLLNELLADDSFDAEKDPEGLLAELKDSLLNGATDTDPGELPPIQQAIIAQRVATSLQAAMGFFKSLENGDTRGIVSSGVNLANLLDGYSTEIDLNLNGIANAINILNRIDRFSDTLSSGDSLAALEAGLLLGSSSANIISILGTDSSGAAVSSLAGQLGGYLGSAASVLSLVQNLQDGNEVAAVGDGLIAYATATQTAVAAGLVDASLASANPYLIAAAIAISVILDATADKPYQPSSGGASVLRSEIYLSNGFDNDDQIAFDIDGLTVVANGTSSTDYDIFAEQLSIKWAELEGVVGVKSDGATITQKVLSEMLDNLQDSLPEGAGIIPERLPSLSFNGDHFVISIVNPESGERMNIATPPGGVIDKLEQAAYAGQAIVPEWELATVEAKYVVYQQQKGEYNEAQYEQEINGDPNKLPLPLADYWQPDALQAAALDLVTSTRSVAIADLANDGIDILSRAAGVRFDMDDDSFFELTEWVGPNDALVAIDRNLNGIIDTGNDLFAGNFAWLDANNDKRFSADDPAFGYMRFWQDSNSNGLSDAGEMLTLDSLGVSEVYEENGSLYGRKENGEVIPIAIRDLGFDANGERRISMPDGGTLIINESGSMLWSGGTVSDLSGFLTTGGGNVASSPIVVLTGEEDIIGDASTGRSSSAREPRQQLRIEGSQLFNGPMVAIMALGLGVSYTSQAGMLAFNEEELSAIKVPAADAQAPLAGEAAASSLVVLDSTNILASSTTTVDANSLPDLINSAGLVSGMSIQGLSSTLQAMLAQPHFDFSRLGLEVEQAEGLLAELLSAQSEPVEQLNVNDDEQVLLNLLSVSNKDLPAAGENPDKLTRHETPNTPGAIIADTPAGESVLDEANLNATTATVVAVNSAPVVLGETFSSDEDVESLISISTLLGNDYDPDGDAIQLDSISNAQNATVTLLDNGQIQFVPNPDFNGQASFEYSVVDVYGASSVATATINVLSINDAPVLSGETISNGSEDALQIIAPALLLQNDSDVDGGSLAIQSVQNARNGAVSFSTTGDILFAPTANFNGLASFDYTVSDGQGGTATAQASVQIAAVNDRPFAGADGLSALEDARRVFSASELLRNDYDVDGDRLTVTAVAGAQNGSVSLSSGQISYRPNRNYSGSDTFSYTVSDGNGGTATGLVSVNVAAVNDNPYFTVGRYTSQSGRQRTDGIVKATDPDGSDSAIRYSISGGNQPLIGSATVNAGTGSWSYYSNNYNNTDANFNFIITATDGQGGRADIAIPVHQFGGGPNNAQPLTIQQVYGRTAFLPVVLDLDGDGIELTSLDKSTVSFDTNGDGYSSRIAWVKADDGLLAWDGNQDNNISYDEISFASYSEQAETDLQGLQAFDSNNDNQLTSEDAEWQQFVVWQDKDQNGISKEGELKTLDELEITAINLESDQQPSEIAGNEVFGNTEFTREDGSTGIVADVAFDVVNDSFLEELVEEVDEVDMEEIELDQIVDLMKSDMAGFEDVSQEVNAAEPAAPENIHLFTEGSTVTDEQLMAV